MTVGFAATVILLLPAACEPLVAELAGVALLALFPVLDLAYIYF